MNNKYIKRANELFSKKEYAKALQLYKKFQEENKEISESVKFNINNIFKKMYLSQDRIKLYKYKVSIVVPVYNNKNYLEECLNSVISQSLKDIEIIIINDGSTEVQSLEIINKFLKNDDRIKLINKNNTGYGDTLNVGINVASGEYLGIVESDDYISKYMYEKLYHIAKENNCDVVKSNTAVFIGEGENRKITKFKMTQDNNYGKIFLPETNIKAFDHVGFLSTVAGIYSISMLRKYNIKYNNTPGASFQDISFWFKTMLCADTYMFVDEYFYYIRRDNENSSVKDSRKLFPVCFEYKTVLDFINNNSFINKKFLSLYSKRMFLAYKWCYDRADYDLKIEFMNKFQSDFIILRNNNILDLSLFNEKELVYMNKILDYKNSYSFENFINIIYILDEKYFIPTMTSIQSLIINSNISIHYKIYICHVNVSNEKIEMLKNLSSKNFEIKIFNLKKQLNSFTGKYASTVKNVSETALLKFYLSNIFLDIDKAIYIDGDTLILTDLYELYSTNISGYYCGAVLDIPWGVYKPKTLKEKTFSMEYINSGVLLLNLKMLREHSICDKLISAKATIKSGLMDQDAFNYIFKGHVIFLHIRYNLIIDALYRHILKNKISIRTLNKIYNENFSCFDDIFNIASIIHFGSYYKPWNFYDMICSDLWYYYFKTTKLSPNSISRISRLNIYFNKKN